MLYLGINFLQLNRNLILTYHLFQISGSLILQLSYSETQYVWLMTFCTGNKTHEYISQLGTDFFLQVPWSCFYSLAKKSVVNLKRGIIKYLHVYFVL